MLVKTIEEWNSYEIKCDECSGRGKINTHRRICPKWDEKGCMCHSDVINSQEICEKCNGKGRIKRC